jgi:FdhE protein
MIEQAVSRLDQIARADATVAPLARLQAEVLKVAAADGWDDGVPELDPKQAEQGVPLLDGQTLRVDGEAQRRLLVRLAKATARESVAGAASSTPAARAVEQGTLDAVALLACTVTQDAEAFERLSDSSGLDATLLATLAHLAALPLLLACGRRAAPLLDGVRWQAGSCPVCAAWPTLAEMRGLARDRYLRCGRCGSAWRFEQAGCVYCGNQDKGAQSYFAAERERESRRAAICDACHGYLKTFATLGPLDPAELLVRDLQSLELDVTAIEHSYARPDGLGSALSVRVAPAPPRSGEGWRRWWR